MAEILVSAVSEALISKLVGIASDEISLVWGVREEMSRLQKTLRSIQAVLTDAERQQVEKETVKLWLENLKDAVYEAEDIVDEFQYAAHKRKVEGRKRDKVKNFFSGSNPLGFSHKIAHKIKDLNQMLDQISKDKDMFSFNVHESTSSNKGGSSRNKETHSLEDVSMFVGRQKEISEIIDLLLDCSDDQQIYRIFLIVAMGGVGKSSLARIIYGDDVVRQHFEIRLWVCVSDNSNQFQVFNQLLESINGEKKEYSSLDVMVNIVTEKFRNKRYLIVLDDMWKDDHNEWDDMLNDLLLLGAPGSKMIITSRINDVVSPMSFLLRYNLSGLSEDDCWTMLEKIAFGREGVGKTTKLIKIGINIARKCRGLPLTIKVLGRLMYSKKSEHDWQLIANNEIWNLPAGETKVISVLKLSYDHLEPHLKQCFRYCSLYPKDCIIKRKNLIRIWMAEGFLGHSRSSIEMEALGNEYFNSLLSNSFLQEEKKNEFGIIKSCRMHDLVHDLAVSVAKSESSIISANKIIEEDISRLRRVSLVFENNEFSPLPGALAKVKKLRAFISSDSEFIDNSYIMQIFMNFNYIRVLDLSWSSIGELPPSIAKLKYLRYFNLTCSELKVLPSSFTTLYNLQTLILKKCLNLKVLPEEMRKLTKLSHLVFDYRYPMLKKARFLTSLIYLPVFVVGNKKEGCGIEELRDLNLLSGKLKIYNLENISNGKDAEWGGMKEKKHLLQLELHWKRYRNGEDICENDIHEEDTVLEGLQPHQNLKRLGIYNYFGSKFPTWMMDPKFLLLNLVHVVLEDCNKCECLPPFGLLPLLKVLRIYRLNAVKNIGNEFYGDVSSFLSLESLTIGYMQDLVEWSDQVSSSSYFFSSFPRLAELTVVYCPKLKLMPNRFPSLKTLYLGSCNGKRIGPLVKSNQSSLTSIKIHSCRDFVSLPLEFVRGNNILSRLDIDNCDDFQGFTSLEYMDLVDSWDIFPNQVLPSNSVNRLTLWNCGLLYSHIDLRGFNSLRELRIVFGDSQKSIGVMESIISKKSGIEYLPKLAYLQISSLFEELEFLPFPNASIGKRGTLIGTYFPSLRELSVYGWSKINCLPDQIQYIPSLQILRITDFDSLVALPEWLGNLVSLRGLYISECKNLKDLPSKEKMLRLTSLQDLYLTDCDLLMDRCKKGGEEAYKLSPEILKTPQYC